MAKLDWTWLALTFSTARQQQNCLRRTERPRRLSEMSGAAGWSMGVLPMYRIPQLSA
jgi:hypothetical protein